MSFPLEGPLPVIDLTAGCVLVIQAVDPTDGSNVGGVTITDGVAWVDNKGAIPDDDIGTLRVWLQPSTSQA